MMSILDLLFPRRCLGCQKWGQYFCPDCRGEIVFLEKQICPVCQKPAIHGLTHPSCQAKYSLDGLISVFAYKGLVKKAIIKLKYKLVTDLAQELVGLSTEFLFNLQSAILNHKFLTLIPVPLHSYRQRQRGFNQAQLLGKILAENFDWPARNDLLMRIRYTKPQVKLKKEARGQNIRGAFAFKKNSRTVIHDSKLVLFDDVWTTGSTLKEAGKILKRAGIKKVYGLTLAR